MGYNLLKIFVFYKLKPNKWIILGSAIIALILSTIVSGTDNFKGLSVIFSGLGIVLLLWFVDLCGGLSNMFKKKEKELKIKPKAKPNRVRKN
jgi:hypothetical protein